MSDWAVCRVQAVVCGVKYKWSKPYCVTRMTEIEKSLEAQGTPEAELNDAAVQLVVAVIKSDQFEKYHKHKKVTNFARCIAKVFGGAALSVCYNQWNCNLQDAAMLK